MSRPHPHFDERGTLDWHSSWDEAWAEARAAEKPLFIEIGRQQCPDCRVLVETVVPRPDIGPLLSERFVCLACDCDEPEQEVYELADHIEAACSLPLVVLAAPDGSFLEGSSGAIDVPSLRTALLRVSGEAP